MKKYTARDNEHYTACVAANSRYFLYAYQSSLTKILFLVLLYFMAAPTTNAQGIGIGIIIPDSSSILEVKASNKGMLIPRTSTASRVAIAKPAKGLLIFDTTTSSFWFYKDTSWANLSINTTSLGIPTPGDYDNDGKADVSVYYPAEKKWVVKLSSNGTLSSYTFSITNTNVIPVPADYDGDGKTDMSVYDNNTKKWIIRKSSDLTILTVTIDF